MVSKYNCRTCTRVDCPVWNGEENRKDAQSGKTPDTHFIIGLSLTCGFCCHSELKDALME